MDVVPQDELKRVKEAIDDYFRGVSVSEKQTKEAGPFEVTFYPPSDDFRREVIIVPRKAKPAPMGSPLKQIGSDGGDVYVTALAVGFFVNKAYGKRAFGSSTFSRYTKRLPWEAVESGDPLYHMLQADWKRMIGDMKNGDSTKMSAEYEVRTRSGRDSHLVLKLEVRRDLDGFYVGHNRDTSHSAVIKEMRLIGDSTDITNATEFLNTTLIHSNDWKETEK